MTVQDQGGSVGPLRRQLSDAALQRRAMLAMLLAMLVMALGLPLHLATLSDHNRHTSFALPIAWLSAALTLGTLGASRHALCKTWRSFRRLRLRDAELVAICALIAFVASLPSLVDHRAPMYFDVTAMALAWLLSGEAQSMAIRRRFASMVEQLAPLNPPPHSLAAPAADLDDPHARWLSGVILGFSFAALIWQTHTGTIANGLLTALAVAAASCPCTLGIVRSSAWANGSERALVLGWLIPEGAAWSRLASVPEAAQLALKLGAADESALFSLARAVRRTIRWNYLWSIGFNVVLLPLALFGPVPALLPAITMLLARLLIWLTTRRLGMG